MEKHMTTKKSKAKSTTKDTQAAQVAAPAVDAQESVALEPVQLTIADLQLLSRIIDLASRRGAFQAAELSQVGDAFNKLTGFLAYVDSIQSKEEADTAAEATATEVESEMESA